MRSRAASKETMRDGLYGSAKRDFIFSTDCSIGIINACIYGFNCGPINLGSGKALKISKLISNLNEINNLSSSNKHSEVFRRTISRMYEMTKSP